MNWRISKGAVDALNAVSTVVIAMATVVTVCVTWYHATILTGQLEVAQKQAVIMEADQRPWVGIDRVETSPIVAGQPLIIRPVYKNTGRTPALSWSAAFDSPAIREREAGFEDRTLCGPTCGRGVMVPSGEFRIEISMPAEQITAELVDAVMKQEKTIFIRGMTDYRDFAQRSYKTTTCMAYNPFAVAFGHCTREGSNFAN